MKLRREKESGGEGVEAKEGGEEGEEGGIWDLFGDAEHDDGLLARLHSGNVRHNRHVQ